MHNPVLANERGITLEDREIIDEYHNKLIEICTDPQSFVDEGIDPVELIKAYEFDLQKLWGFNKSEDHHTWWLKIKGCTCPEMDNRDYFGTPYKIYNLDCPWHGGGKPN